MKKKIVYQDGDYTKVLYGEAVEDDVFVIVTDIEGNVIKIGKRFVISISEKGE